MKVFIPQYSGFCPGVKFAEKTPAGYLRAPVFMRLRDDKTASEVRAAEVIEPPPFSAEEAVELSKSTRQILESR